MKESEKSEATLAVFVDFEKLALGLSDKKEGFFDIKKGLERHVEKGKVVVTSLAGGERRVVLSPDVAEMCVPGWTFSGVIGKRRTSWDLVEVWNAGGSTRHLSRYVYDLASDPQELHNIAPEHPDLVKDLLGRMHERFVEGRWRR